jgi:hypothetical protein
VRADWKAGDDHRWVCGGAGTPFDRDYQFQKDQVVVWRVAGFRAANRVLTAVLA